jgi:hypothetical protein
MAWLSDKEVGVHFKEAGKCLFWNLLGSLLPVYGGFLLFLICKKTPSLHDFSNNGEFAIYSAAMLGTAFYIVLKEYKMTRFAYRNTLGILCVLSLIVTTFLFFGVTAANSGQLLKDIDRGVIRDWSFGVYFVSIALAFILTGLDKLRTQRDVDLEKDRQKEVDKLGKQVDELKG